MSRDNRDTVVVPRWVVQSLLRQRFAFTDEATTALEELLVASTREIPWSMVRPLLSQFSEDTDPVRTAAVLDQLQEYARGRLAELEVNLRDPRVLYETVCVLGLVAESARNGRDNGVLTADTAAEIQSVCRSLGAAIGRFAPAEAFAE